MLKLRKACFETNSSSTHAICIPQFGVLIRKYILFSLDCFGWECGEADADDYLYTAICELYGSDAEKFEAILTHITDVCKKYICEVEFSNVKWTENGKHRYVDIEYGYIDHVENFKPLLDDLLKDEGLLVAYLSGACVFTGNDNSEEDRIDDIVESYTNMGYTVYEKDN